MRKYLLLPLVAAVMGAQAQAGSISFDSRAELEVNQYNDSAETVPSGLKRDSHRFVLQTLRLDSKGNFTDDTSFRLRFRLNQSSTSGLGTQNAQDNLNSAIDYAFIQHKWMDGLAFQLGKFGTDIGGIEGMTSGADLYLTSYAYNGTRLRTNATTGSVNYAETNPLRYATGAKLIYAIGDHELSAMVTNQETAAVDTSGTFYQTHDAYGLVLKGNFMDKALTPVLSYHEDNVQGTGQPGTGTATVAGADKKYTFAAAGARYDMGLLFFELDYLYNTFKNRTTLDETDKTNTIVGTLGGRYDRYVFKLKADSSRPEIFTSTGTSITPTVMGYQAALEFLPTGDKNFRYHLVYIQRDVKGDVPGGGSVNDTQTQQQVLVGMRIFADFLK